MAERSSIARAFSLALDFADARLARRLVGLSDDAFFWEPVPNCWSVRRVEDSTIERNIGDVVDGWIQERQGGEPQPPPFTTIAWRLVRLAWLNTMWHDYAFGGATLAFAAVAVPHTAASAISMWDESFARFRTPIDGRTEEQVARAYDFPGGSRRTVGAQLSIFLAENTHHGVEIGCLRDLYRATG